MEVIDIKNIAFPVDDDLFFRLKVICLKKDITLKDFLTNLIKEEVSKQEAELK